MNIIRLSEEFPDEFQRYMELFVTYSPKKSFFVKEAYTDGFYQRKKKDKITPLPLYPQLATETVERHLDPEKWSDWRRFADPNQYSSDHPIWLGLNAARFTRLDALDVDAKEYLIGYYSPYNKLALRKPVVLLPLSYFQKLKRIFDFFPDRIWCISSDSLGMHIWGTHQRLKKTKDVHAERKVDLAAIGLEQIEVHPMFGRCFRRPFGKDYKTITPNGVIEKWQDQINFFNNPKIVSPTFQQIVMALLRSMIRQAKSWSSSKFSYNKNGKKLKKADVSKIKDEITLIHKWLKAGCFSVDPTPSFKNVPSNNLFLDKGDWYHSLLRYAINGLDKDDSIFDVVYDLAKWLYWIDLYDVPESKRKAEINNILIQYIKEKNNGFVTRLLKGKDKNVYSQIGRIIKLASSRSDEKSLSLFQRIREKIKNNKYNNKTRILDAILHEYSCSTYMFMPPQKTINPFDLLPEPIEAKIIEKQGKKKVFPFANKLINKLISLGGRARLGQKWFVNEGFKDPNKTKERIDLLISVGVIRRGDSYSKGRFAKEYSIPESLLIEHWPHLAK